MGYADFLRERFADLNPEVDDLFLLEAHQIADLPNRAPPRELAAVLHAHPRLHRFFIARHPQIEGYLARLLTDHGPVAHDEVEACELALVWEIADWIVYERAPEYYDARSDVDWDPAAVTEIVSLAGKTVIDAGSGTGRVALSVAPMARHVFAVEPVASLRRYLRDQAAHRQLDNLFVTDGYLHAIPLPAATADVLLTCQAIGWALPDELAEIDRVVRPGGIAVHLFGTREALDPDNPLAQALVAAGYRADVYAAGQLRIARYRKRVEGR